MTLMSTEVIGLPRGRALTRADLATMPEDGHRYELIDGILIVSPAPRIRHQDVVGSLHLLLHASISPPLKVLMAPVDVVLAESTVIQPDLLVADVASFTEIDLPGPPLLAVEVLSPSTRNVDLLLKKERLQRAACAHYWVVDPDEPSITAWALDDGAYVEVGRAAGDATLALTTPFPVTVAPADLVR